MVLTELILAHQKRHKAMAAATTKTNGGGIQNNIPRKNAAAIIGHVFQRNTPGHNTILGFEGVQYDDDVTLRQMSDYIVSDVPPLANQYNNATLPQAPALQVTSPGKVVTTARFTRINPPEKSVLHTSGKPDPLVKRAGGGPSPSTDTPFHPTAPPPPPVHRSRPTSSQHTTFVNRVRNSGSFLRGSTATGTLATHAHSDLSASRWTTVKRGAAG